MEGHCSTGQRSQWALVPMEEEEEEEEEEEVFLYHVRCWSVEVNEKCPSVLFEMLHII